MKKVLSLTLASALACAIFTGCGNNETNSESESLDLTATDSSMVETTEPATEVITEPETTTEPETEPETEQETEPETTEPADEKDEELIFFDDLIQKTITAYQNTDTETYLKCTTDEIQMTMMKDNPKHIEYGIDYSTHEKIAEYMESDISLKHLESMKGYYFLGNEFNSEYIVTQNDIDINLTDMLKTYYQSNYIDTDYITSGQAFTDYNFEDFAIVYGTFTGTDNTLKPRRVYLAKINGDWYVDTTFYSVLEYKEKLELTDDQLGANKYEIGADGHYIVK